MERHTGINETGGFEPRVIYFVRGMVTNGSVL